MAIDSKPIKTKGLPTHFKIDIAHEQMRIAIEVDGFCHAAFKVKEKDARKDKFLISKGWTVLRFLNKDVLNWINSGMQAESAISMTFKQHGIKVSV